MNDRCVLIITILFVIEITISSQRSSGRLVGSPTTDSESLQLKSHSLYYNSDCDQTVEGSYQNIEVN